MTDPRPLNTNATQSYRSLAHLYADSIEHTLSRAETPRPIRKIVDNRVRAGDDRKRLHDALDILILEGRVTPSLIDGIPHVERLAKTPRLSVVA